MARKVSIQKGFVFGVAVVAIVAILTGVILKMSNISASTTTTTNADAVSNCYIRLGGTNCYETMARACTRTESLATKTSASPTAQEKAAYGEQVKAWNLNINDGNPEGKFRVILAARRASNSSTRVDIALTPLIRNWGGNGDSVYLIFSDGLGYKKRYNYITKQTTWSSYINATESTGDVDLMFVGKNEDGCAKSLLNLNAVLGTSPTATVTASRSASATATSSASRTATASATRTSTASTVASIVPVGSIAPNTLTQGARIEYFSDMNLEKGIYAQKVSRVSFNWGIKSPAPGIGIDKWSDRTTAKILAPATGEYYIGVAHNDGARVWLGGRKIIDDWKDWAPCDRSCNNDAKIKRSAAKVTMEKGKLYDLKVEHYDKSDNAVLYLYWKTPNSTTGVLIPASAYFTSYNPNPPHGSGTGLLGTYFNFNNMDQFKFWRKDARVNFSWGVNAPRSDMNKDNFSVRWTGKIRPRFSETYTFRIASKDGVRLWVNNKLIIDKWQDFDKLTSTQGSISLIGGKLYPIKVEYYNSKAEASIQMKWTSPSERLNIVPTGDLYYPGAPNVSPGASVTPSRTASASPTVLKLTLKPGWNAISIPDASNPISASALRTDPYNFLTFAFDGATTQNGKIVRTWNSSPNIFFKKMGYYIKNPGSHDEIVELDQGLKTTNQAVVYKGWNLLSNSSDKAVALSSMSYTKKDCMQTGENPITCQGSIKTISLKDLSYGKVGEGKQAYTYVYYVAKPNADSNTPNPFTIFNVAAKGGPANVVIPARGVFWLYLF